MSTKAQHICRTLTNHYTTTPSLNTLLKTKVSNEGFRSVLHRTIFLSVKNILQFKECFFQGSMDVKCSSWKHQSQQGDFILRVHISYGSHMFKDTSKARSNLNEQYKMKNVHIHTHMMMVSLPRSNIIIPENTNYVLAFLNDIVEAECLFIYLKCHKPTDGPVTSPISPQTVNPSGEHYHWSIPHRSLLCWLCLPAHCWSLIYSPCLQAHRAEPSNDLRNEVWPHQPLTPLWASLSISFLVSMRTWMTRISQNPTLSPSRSISIREWQVPFRIHGRRSWQWLTWVIVYIMAATYYSQIQN